MGLSRPSSPADARILKRPRRRWRGRFAAYTATLALAALSVVLPATSASAQNIYCDAQPQYPHASTHVHGTVNVVATVSCDAPVDYIIMTISLVRDDQYVSDSSCTS